MEILSDLPRKQGRSWAGLAMAMVTLATLGGLAGARFVSSAERPPLIQDGPDRRLAQQLALLDEPLASKDRTRAIYVWHDAYGLALATRRWEAMLAVGSAAVKLDALTRVSAHHPTYFQTQARAAYLVALFRARDAREPEGVERVAEAFAVLGDIEMAARARTVLVQAARR